MPDVHEKANPSRDGGAKPRASHQVGEAAGLPKGVLGQDKYSSASKFRTGRTVPRTPPKKGNTLMTMKRTSVALSLAFLLATVFGGVALAKTINGTAKGETLRGTNSADDMNGRGGNDDLRGRGGADKVQGGPGNDTVYGMDGSDKNVAGGVGEDDLYGGVGNDTLRAAGDGDPDNVYCDEGTDTAIVEIGDAVDDQQIVSETLLPVGTTCENIEVRELPIL